MSARRSATVLKILAGTDRADRRRDDAKVKPPGRPVVPAGEVLTERERFFWKWYADGFIDSVHGKIDGSLLLRLVRATVRLEKLESAAGEVFTETAGGRRMMNPVYAAMTGASREYRALLAEAGLSPSARLKFAPLLKGHGGSWDDV